MKILLTQDKIALIDDKDFPLISEYKWRACKNRDTYYAMAHIRKNGKRTGLLMHRLILNAPKEMETDHINHNGLDNRRSNLRFATNQQNSFNQKINKKKSSSSEYKGVSWNKRDKKWYAQIYIDYKLHYLGYFDDEQDAALAYNEAAKKLFGEYACLNLV